MKKKTIEDYRRLEEERNIKWLGTELPKDVRHNTKWECCICGHRWETRYSHIVNDGSGCSECVRLSYMLPIGAYVQLAVERGMVWAGDKRPRNTHVKTAWLCRKCLGVFYSPYQSVKSRGTTGCPECQLKEVQQAQRLTPQDFVKFEDRDILWRGNRVPLSKERTEFECGICGYKWATVYTSINRGSGCPKCAGCAKKTKADYLRLAQEKGLEFIGPMSKRTIHKIKWKCKNGHVFKHCYDFIQKGCGCPDCPPFINGKRVSKPQIVLSRLIDGKLNYQVGTRFVDIALPEKKIGIEYDCWYWHGHKPKKDYSRAMWFVRNGWRIIAVKAKEEIPSIEQIEDAIYLTDKFPYIEIIMGDWGNGSLANAVLQ